jgi:hypothetical protein
MALTTYVAGNVLTAQQLNDSFAAVGGLRAVVPTSVTVTGAGSSSSVGANGKITFGTAESVSINGVFSSTFDNYRFIFDATPSTSNNIDIRLRVGGVDNSTSNSYIFQLVDLSSTTSSPSRVTTTAFRGGTLTLNSTYTSGFIVDVINPFAAARTNYYATNQDAESGARMRIFVGTHNQATSYDGFSLICSTGNITGTVTVYGYFG